VEAEKKEGQGGTRERRTSADQPPRVVAKPVAGGIELIQKTGEGISATLKGAEMDLARKSYPRYFGNCLVLVCKEGGREEREEGDTRRWSGERRGKRGRTRVGILSSVFRKLSCFGMQGEERGGGRHEMERWEKRDGEEEAKGEEAERRGGRREEGRGRRRRRRGVQKTLTSLAAHREQRSGKGQDHTLQSR
jgi:hypothetical protein